MCIRDRQDTEVPEMPILVVNHGVEHQHTSDFLCGLLADFLIIVQTSLNAVCFYQMADRDIRRINIREQLAFGRENIFPALQIVVDGMKPHTLRDLAGVIFAVRLASGIGPVSYTHLDVYKRQYYTFVAYFVDGFGSLYGSPLRI